MTAGTLLVAQAAGAERSGRRQVAVDTATTCTHLVTAAWVASVDATRFYKSAISKII